MTTGLSSVGFRTWVTLPLALLVLHLAATAIEPVRGACAGCQLPLSGTLTPRAAPLVSSNGAFALGFFSANGVFGFGIWYAQLVSLGFQTVVWMPRRDLTLSGAAFVQLSPGGVLQLFEIVDSALQPVWTSGNDFVSHP